VKKILVVLTFLIIAVTNNSFAADAESKFEAANDHLRIGIVDFRYLMQNANVTVSIDKQIDDKRKEFKDKDAEIQKELVARQQRLTNQKAILSAKDFEKERTNLEVEIKNAQTESSDRVKILQNGIQEANNFLDQAIRKYIAIVAKEKGLSLILPKELIILSDKDLSLTTEVLALVNSDLKDAQIKFGSTSSVK
jgi:Skp family chaperone for outer membrane proteins